MSHPAYTPSLHGPVPPKHCPAPQHPLSGTTSGRLRWREGNNCKQYLKPKQSIKHPKSAHWEGCRLTTYLLGKTRGACPELRGFLSAYLELLLLCQWSAHTQLELLGGVFK